METFTWSPAADAEGEIQQRVRTVQFGDGYAQVAGDGLNADRQSWPLTFTGAADEIRPIRDFLRRHGGHRSFLWAPPLEGLQLYRCAGWRLRAHTEDLLTLTATFEQSFAP